MPLCCFVESLQRFLPFLQRGKKKTPEMIVEDDVTS